MIFVTGDVPACDIGDTIYAMQQKNLVYNGNFLYFSNKKNVSGSVDYGHPDGWVYENKGREGQITSFDNCCRIVVNSEDNEMTFKQALHEFPRWESFLPGKIVTLSACMELSGQSKACVALDDGVNRTSCAMSAEKKDEYIFDLQLRINENAKGLEVIISSSSNNAVISIRKVFANIGKVAIETLPPMVSGIIGERKQYISTQNPPAEELSLCRTSEELSNRYTRLNSVLNKRFGEGRNGNSTLPDVRGYFSRAWDNKAGIDPDASTRTTPGNKSMKGDLVGTTEADEFREHTHQLAFKDISIFSPEKGSPATGLNLLAASKTKPQGGAETRPKNIAELYTIKWA